MLNFAVLRRSAMGIRELAKRMFFSFFIIFSGAVLSMYVFLMIMGANLFPVRFLTMLILIAFVTNLTQLILYSKNKLSKKQLFLRYALIALMVVSIVISSAVYMEWIYWNFSDILLMATLVGGVTTVVLVFVSRQEQLEGAAFIDPLTKVYNRRYFMKAATRALNACIKENRDFALIMLDLDHFKAINDTHGHSAGDEVLKITVARLTHVLAKNTLMARIGGEEFVVMITDAGRDSMINVAGRIQKSLTAAPFEIGDLLIAVTASFGIAAKQPDAANLSDIIANSDKALYMAKADGRNTVVYYDGD
jgi:diguanylate cyclase (GGDEF)-like protein